MGTNKNRESTFRFRQFSVRNSLSAMKVGTDGVLLGAWTDAAEARTALDVGTGTGLVALMLAQRYPSLVTTAIDLDAGAVAEACANVADSPWPDSITVECCDFDLFAPGCRYDLIVSNPPYFVDSLASVDTLRTMARHTVGLSYRSLIRRSTALLASGGTLAMILPAEFEDDLTFCAAMHGLYLKRLTRVCTKPTAPPKRILVALTDTPCPIFAPDTLTIGTPAYHTLVSPYYL